MDCPQRPIPTRGQGSQRDPPQLRDHQDPLTASCPAPQCADGHTEATSGLGGRSQIPKFPWKTLLHPCHFSRTLAPLSTPTLTHSTRMSDSDWGAPLPPLPSVAETACPLAFSSCQEAPGKQTWWLSLHRETPLSPALSCKGALAKNQTKKGTSPSYLLRGNLFLHVSHLHVERRPVVDTPGIDRPSCAPPMESLGQGLHMLSPFLSFSRPACPQKVCIQLLLPLPHIKAYS